MAKDLITILIADDDPDDREMTREALTMNQLRNPLQFVEDGDAVIDYLNDHVVAGRAASLPGLILLDLNMPKRDGRETTAAIKADPRFRHIPVVILTTSKADEDIFRSYEVGASSYITKPVTFDALLTVIGTLGKYWLEVVELPVEDVR